MKAIGLYVGILRIECGLTQDQLAVAAHISPKTVRNLESGRHEPKVTKLGEIVALVRGSAAHIARLMDPMASIELARMLANEVINNPNLATEETELVSKLSGLKGQRRQTAIQVLRDLLAAEERGEAP